MELKRFNLAANVVIIFRGFLELKHDAAAVLAELSHLRVDQILAFLLFFDQSEQLVSLFNYHLFLFAVYFAKNSSDSPENLLFI